MLARAVRARRDAGDARRPGGVRRARLEPRSPLWLVGAGGRRARRSRAMGVAIGGAHARGPRRRRCWRSCSRCRSRSWRWSRRGARQRRRSTTSSTSSPALFPFKPALRALDAAISGGDATHCRYVHLLGPHRSGFWRDRTALAPAVRLTYSSRAVAFPATRLRRLRAHRPAARPRARDRAVGRPPRLPDVRRARAPRAGRRSRRMPGIDHLSIDGAVEEAGEAAALGIPGRAAVRAARRARTSRAPARGTTRA